MREDKFQELLASVKEMKEMEKHVPKHVPKKSICALFVTYFGTFYTKYIKPKQHRDKPTSY